MAASVVAKRCTQTFATRPGAIVGSIAITWRLQAVLVQHVQNVVVRAMVQLLHRGLLHVFRREVLSVLFMAPRQDFVLDGFDAKDFRMAGMERSGRHELLTDLSSLRPMKIYGLQPVTSMFCCTRLVIAIARMRVPEILPSAVTSDEAWAFLSR